MLTAIIADDEKHILTLIKNLADWDLLGISVVGEVQDGLEALELVRCLKPDILLTDIRMPGMDGLELSRKVKDINKNISIIIISGFKQFDYAYGAIKYGVEDFLIKPINKVELNEVLSQICRKRNENQGENERVLDLEWKIRDGEATIRKLLIEEGIKGKRNPITPTMVSNLRNDNKGHCCFAIKFDFSGATETNYEAILDHTDTILKSYFSQKDIGLDISIAGDMVVCLLSLTSLDTDSILRLTRNFYEVMHLRLDIFPNLVFSIGLSDPFESVERTPLAVQEAIIAVKCKAILGAGSVISASKIGLEIKSISLEEEQSYRLSCILEAFSETSLHDWLVSIFGADPNFYQSKPWEAVSLSENVLEEFRQRADQSGIQVIGEYWSAFAAELSNATSLNNILSTLEGGIHRIVLANYEEKLNRENLPVRMAKQYMKDHLQEQITLDDIATSVSLSPSYFSSLFKKNAGVNVSEYLLGMRVAEAKQLLKTSMLNISEIANCVGYTDPKHFSKVFAKETSIKPQQYRKLYSR